MLIFLKLLFIFFNQNPEGETLWIEVEGLRNYKGQLLVSVSNSGKKFPAKDKQAFRAKAIVLKKGEKVIVSFADLPNGDYAVSLLHDENMDEKMNFNFLGIPKEGFGFSNNAKGKLGPPSFEDAKFTVKGQGIRTSIRLKYF